MFVTKAILFAALAAFAVNATPTPEAPTSEELVILDTRETSFGTLTYYGRTASANTTASAPALTSRSCGSNDVTCDGSNVPNASTCKSLIASLSANGNTRLPITPFSVCLNSGGTCCVSWHDLAGNLQEKHLVNAANAAYNGCVVRGLSGATSNTNLEGTCTRQCLSNRPDNC